MKQYEAVIQTLEKLGGQATFAELNIEVMKVKDCKWDTKTPFASIRRIVQVRHEIFKVRPGLWALESYKAKLGLVEESAADPANPTIIQENHSYYQGLLAQTGNLRGFSTFIPNQDMNKLFKNIPLKQIRTLQVLPPYSYDTLVRRSSTVDVIWFNERQMPHSYFEVEHSTDIQNSLLKFHDLQDFYARMVIVADENRRKEFDHKLKLTALKEIKSRVFFLGYAQLVKKYEAALYNASQIFVL